MKATGARALETPTTGARPQIAHRHPAPTCQRLDDHEGQPFVKRREDEHVGRAVRPHKIALGQTPRQLNRLPELRRLLDEPIVLLRLPMAADAHAMHPDARVPQKSSTASSRLPTPFFLEIFPT